MIRPPENNQLDFPNQTSLNEPNQSINQLPDDCMGIICRSLSIRDILTMEEVSQSNRSSRYLKSTWTQLCKEKKIPVDWSKLFGNQNNSFPEKFTYRTEMALQYFLNDRKELLEILDNKEIEQPFPQVPGKKLRKNHGFIREQWELMRKDQKETIEMIDRRFKSVGAWNSFLAIYISDDLQKIANNILSEDNSLQLATEEEIKTDEEEVFIESYFNSSHVLNFGHVLKPGVLLLHGLSQLANYNFQAKNYIESSSLHHPQLLSARLFLKSALQRGVVHTHSLVKKILPEHRLTDLRKVLADLAMFSASQKDYQGLEQCLKYEENLVSIDNFLYYLSEKYNKIYPPMYIFRVKEFINKFNMRGDGHMWGILRDLDFNKARSSFKEGIESYQQENSPIPAKVWLVGADMECTEEKWGEANDYMNRAMAAFGESIPYKVWELRAIIKENLGEIQEAILSLKHILEACEYPLTQKEANDFNYFKSQGFDKIKIIYRMGKKQKFIQENTLKSIKYNLNRLSSNQ